MVFVKVLWTITFLTGAFAGFLWTFSKEKSDEFFSEMTADGSGKFHTFRLGFWCISFIVLLMCCSMSK
ncbi:hypothetical protein C6W27_10630 [Bacillus paralicheniformis]|nr:hypothetical protein C6W27_10630 [Bacillus paralicheniformis]